MHGHHAAGDVHREDPEQCEHRQRNAVAVPQRRGDQHHRRNGEAVGRQVGHRGDVELDVGHRGERRRQRGGGGGGPGGPPLAEFAVPQQIPRQHAALTGNSQTAAASEFRVYAVVGAAPVS